MGDFITDVSIGKKPVIKNIPVVPLKAEDFREILSKCYDMAQSGEDKFDVMLNCKSKFQCRSKFYHPLKSAVFFNFLEA